MIRRNSIEFCKKEIPIVTEDADGCVYTIIAKHIQDLLNDWNGTCDFVPSNDAPVHYAVYKGEIIKLPQDCDFETMMSMLAAAKEINLEVAV